MVIACVGCPADVVTGFSIGDKVCALLPGGGVAPIDISSLLAKNASQQVKIDLQDLGVVLASSTLYLNTNCTVAGVSAPATVTGNPIPASNPTQQQLAHAMFPLGESTKAQVRAEAAERGLAVAMKPDSHDICFIPDGDTRSFLTNRLGEPWHAPAA